MSNTVPYISQPGDRWDLIAYKAYGTVGQIVDADGNDVNAMSLICQANLGIPATTDVLQEGLLLAIPVIPTANVATNLAALPPWKQ